ncbi:hypothetical protein JXI42_13260 [bacterium]|nr:hypothetical protein [bacterium]
MEHKKTVCLIPVILFVVIYGFCSGVYSAPLSCELELFANSTDSVCFGETLWVDVSIDIHSHAPPFLFLILWGDGDTTRNFLLNPPWEFTRGHVYESGGDFVITVRGWLPAPDTCADTVYLTVAADPEFIVDAGPDRWMFRGDTVTIGGSPAITGGTPPYHISWTPPVNLTNPAVANPGAFPVTHTTYTMSVTDDFGCSATDSVRLMVDAPPEISNVVFWQTTDGSQQVTICYDFNDDDGDSAAISVAISSDGGGTWTVPVSTVYDTIGTPPNLGSGVMPGTHCFVWDLGEDLPGVESCNFIVEITAMTGLRETLVVLDSFLLAEARGITFDGTALWVNQSPGLPPPSSVDKIFRIDPHSYAKLDSFYYPTFPYGHMEDMAWINDTLYLFSFGMFVPDVRAKIFKIDTATGFMVDTSATIFPGSYTGQGLTSDGVNLWAVSSVGSCYKVDPHTLNATFLYNADTTAGGDTVFVSGRNSDGAAFGEGYLWLVRNQLGYRIFKVDTALGIVVDSTYAPMSSTSGPEGLAYDGRYFWYVENSIHGGTVYRLGTHELEVSTYSSRGCLDSRDPVIVIDPAICGDYLCGGIDYSFLWEVIDEFVFPYTPCSLFISYDGGSTFDLLAVTTNDSTYLWSPVPDTFLTDVVFSVSVVDSFGNPGYNESCSFVIVDAATPVEVSIICPDPCGVYTSCLPQSFILSLYDSSGAGIDTMRTYFTLIINHLRGGADTIYISEPSPYLTFFSDTLVEVSYNHFDGDSVVLTLDSVYNIYGCSIPLGVPVECSFISDNSAPYAAPEDMFPVPGSWNFDTVISVFVNFFDNGAGVLDDSTTMELIIWNDGVPETLFFLGDSVEVTFSPGESVYVYARTIDAIPQHPFCSCPPNVGNASWSFYVCRDNTAPEITDVRFYQRTDGSRLVDIYYFADDIDGDSMYVELQVSNDGGFTWDVLPVTFITPSDTGWVLPSASEEKRITWDMGADYGECDFEESDIRVRIRGEDGVYGCGW